MLIKEPRGLLRYQTAMINNSASPTWRGLGKPYWWRPAIEVMQECRTRPTGLTSAEVRNGLSRHRSNTFADHRREHALAVLLLRFCNSLVLIRIVAAIVSCVVREGCEAGIAAIIPGSCGLGFNQECSASHTVDALRQRITIAYALVSEWSERLFFEHDRHQPGQRQRERHGRATVRALLADARSAGHRPAALLLSAGSELEATGAYRR
ncbi:cation-transporting P-type ATPase [Mesorhizobium erdmanii]|uniref:cation-transporting P-type ATPase n=1 Tax=Mesorhizobium erdmanii TaxID=1777866 RepID=UPI00047DB4B9